MTDATASDRRDSAGHQTNPRGPNGDAIAASHAAMMSEPDAVADLILAAVRKTQH
jgi:hypothetical protein